MPVNVTLASGVVAHSHQHQPLAGAKPTLATASPRPRRTEQLSPWRHKNRRDDGTELVLAQQKHSVRLRGLSRRREGIF